SPVTISHYGKGEEAGNQETGSERLPHGWAENKELYTLRYGMHKSQFLLKAHTVERILIVNVMDLQTEKVFDVTLHVCDFIDCANLQHYNRCYTKPTNKP
ncbi:hypothetical protein GDO86_017922, partial [Hymenochirus boettgeri]